MKQCIAIVLMMCICLSLCSCIGGRKYTVECKDNEVRKMTVRQIKKYYNEEPTREKPNNLVKGAVIRGTGTVTSFTRTSDNMAKDTDGKRTSAFKYEVCIDNDIIISWRAYGGYRSHVELYKGDKVSFVIDGSYTIYWGDIKFDNDVILDKEMVAPVTLLKK